MSTLSKLRGAVQLAAQGTKAAATLAEGVHQSVWGTMGFKGGKRAGQTGGLTGLIYQTVRGTTGLVGAAADQLLGSLEPLARLVQNEATDSPAQLAVVAALNGVMGDQLVASGNPLATTMALRHAGRVLSVGHMPAKVEVTGKLVVLIHGLCMNDLQWANGEQPDLGSALAGAGYTPVYLRYNTGLHTSQNGELLAAQLRMLCENWPVPIEELALVVHSMGGLVSRSALKCAQDTKAAWLPLVKHLVCLGTPHHGAPLERAGHWVDVLLGTNMYSRPFRTLAQLRSSGITDLRHGHVLTADWQGRARFSSALDHRTHLPLPDSVQCFAVAATLASAKAKHAQRLLGDGLVTVNSALGIHAEPTRILKFNKSNQFIAHDTSHVALLHSPAVHSKVMQWLNP